MDAFNTRSPQEIMEELKQYDTPTITNVLATYPEKKDFCLSLYDAWNDSWYTNEDIKCMFPNLGRKVGYAVTVTFGLPEESDTHTFEELYQALKDSPKPTVLCVKQDFPERYKKKNGLAGGNMMTAFRTLGCVGLISDGPSRDIDEVREIGLQYMLTGVTAGHGPFSIKAINTRVNLCDMEVAPGDIIHMDENGAVKFPAMYLEKVAELAKKISEYESTKQRLFAVYDDSEVMFRIKRGMFDGLI